MPYKYGHALGRVQLENYLNSKESYKNYFGVVF